MMGSRSALLPTDHFSGGGMIPEIGVILKNPNKGNGSVQKLRLIYFLDLFFWYLQKVSLIIILIWLARSWWRDLQAIKEEKAEN